MRAVVADRRPLIADQEIGALDLIHALFGTVSIPSAVAAEVVATLPTLPEWIAVVPVADRPSPLPPTAAPDRGEREAIALVAILGAEWLLMDETRGRRWVERLGLSVVVPTLALLRRAGLYISDALVAEALALAGESPDR